MPMPPIHSVIDFVQLHERVQDGQLDTLGDGIHPHPGLDVNLDFRRARVPGAANSKVHGCPPEQLSPHPR